MTILTAAVVGAIFMGLTYKIGTLSSQLHYAREEARILRIIRESLERDLDVLRNPREPKGGGK